MPQRNFLITNLIKKLIYNEKDLKKNEVKVKFCQKRLKFGYF